MRALVKPGQQRTESRAPMRGTGKQDTHQGEQMHPFFANAGPVFGLTGGLAERAPGQALPVQRALATYKEVLGAKREKTFSWSGFHTKVNQDTGIAEGRGAQVEGLTQPWKTKVRWGPMLEGEGTWMVANPLGPDHALGSSPQTGEHREWNKKRKDKQSRAGTEPYVAGHLLNEELGGPGDYGGNLVAIPHTANVNHANQVENMIRNIVNVGHGWVYYRVWTDRAPEFGLLGGPPYTARLTCHWFQLNGDWEEEAPDKGKVPGTEGHVVIPIPPPWYYHRNKGLGADIEITDNLEGHKLRERAEGAARSKVFRHNVVLVQGKQLKAQVRVMAAVNDLLDTLGFTDDVTTVTKLDLDSKLAAIAHVSIPSDVELNASEVLEQAAERSSLEGNEDEIAQALASALRVAPQEREKRHKAIAESVRTFFSTIYKERDAKIWEEMITTTLEMDEAQHRRTEKLCANLLKRVSFLEQEVVPSVAKRARSQISKLYSQTRDLSPTRRSQVDRSIWGDLDSAEEHEEENPKKKVKVEEFDQWVHSSRKILEESRKRPPFEIDAKLTQVLSDPERQGSTKIAVNELASEFGTIAEAAREYVEADKKPEIASATLKLAGLYQSENQAFIAFYQKLKKKLGLLEDVI